MTTKVKATARGDADEARLAQTFDLRKPVLNAAGEKVDQVTAREPLQIDILKVAREGKSGQADQSVSLMALLTDLPVESVRKMLIADARAIEAWLQRINREALTGDADPDEDVFERTFELLVPVETDTAPLTELTIEAPTLESSIAAEKFKTEPEQTCAFLAALSGKTIPLMQKLSRRDVIRMEVWLAPFVQDGGLPMTEAGEI